MVILRRPLLSSIIVGDYTRTLPETAWFIRTEFKMDRSPKHDFHYPPEGRWPGIDLKWSAIAPYVPSQVVHFRNPIWKSLAEDKAKPFEEHKGTFQDEGWVDLPSFIASYFQVIEEMKRFHDPKCPACNEPLPTIDEGKGTRLGPNPDPTCEDRFYFMDARVMEVLDAEYVRRDLRYEAEFADAFIESPDEVDWNPYIDYCHEWLDPAFYAENAPFNIGFFGKERRLKSKKAREALAKAAPGRVIKPMDLIKVWECYAKGIWKAGRRRAFYGPDRKGKGRPKHLTPREWDIREIEVWDELRLKQLFPELRATRMLMIAEFEGRWVTKDEFHDTDATLT
ncbi:MAG: hypothetical protein E3J35_00035 [Methanomassiliicoccales archaeon]|nr:MAG: hypothetical protein E3J35_00035 [Methanomassiliicoccales archaeon]